MANVLWIVAAIAAILVCTFIWAIFRLRKSTGQVRAELEKLKTSDVERLCAECQAVFRSKFSEDLSLDDYEASARLLSKRVDDNSLKQAMARDGFWWYFVLPAGAFLGELLRVHARAQWRDTPDGAPEMRIPVANGEATTFPFDKVFKQATTGGKGDLYAYLMTARNLESAAGVPITEA